MRRFNLILFLGLSACIAVPALAGDSTYSDPHSPSFTLLVPNGWTASMTKGGVNLVHSSSWAILEVVSGAEAPGAMLVQIRPQFERQYKGFKEVTSGTARFGGQQGAYAQYVGVPPSDRPSITKVVTMTNGRMTYVLFMGAELPERQAPKTARLTR